MEIPTGIEEIPSPGLLFALDKVEFNLRRMLDLVDGDPNRLRPHIKTHKCAEILRLQKSLGIHSVKCATLAEANLAAQEGIQDVLLAYPLVGPNLKLFSRLAESYSETSTFSLVVDELEAIRRIERSGLSEPVTTYIDLDVGMHRTGIARENGALDLAREIVSSPLLSFAGIHAYDGHIHQSDLSSRETAFETVSRDLNRFLDDLSDSGIQCPQIISGGTPTFPFHAALAVGSSIAWQCSPGTPVLWDAGYGEHYPDLPFEPAAFLLARVISHPGPDLACLDLGHKSVSAENPMDRRVRFPTLGEFDFVSHSEEHLILRISPSDRPGIGEILLGVPYHVCPTVALYDEASLLADNAYTGKSCLIDARSRKLTFPNRESA